MTYLIIHINGHPVCPDCYGDNFITDLFHAEIYCSECGLVVKDTSIGNIRTAEYLQDRQNTIDKQITEYINTHTEHDKT